MNEKSSLVPGGRPPGPPGPPGPPKGDWVPMKGALVPVKGATVAPNGAAVAPKGAPVAANCVSREGGKGERVGSINLILEYSLRNEDDVVGHQLELRIT